MSDDDRPSAFHDPVVLKQAAWIFRAARARQPAKGGSRDSVILSVNTLEPTDGMDGMDGHKPRSTL
jgi:hypothetical protein